VWGGLERDLHCETFIQLVGIGLSLSAIAERPAASVVVDRSIVYRYRRSGIVFVISAYRHRLAAIVYLDRLASSVYLYRRSSDVYWPLRPLLASFNPSGEARLG